VVIAGRLDLVVTSPRRRRAGGVRLEQIGGAGARDVPLDAVDDVAVLPNLDVVHRILRHVARTQKAWLLNVEASPAPPPA